MQLGDMLISRGLVTQEDIDAATARQLKEGGRLGENLIAMGMVTADQLAQLDRARGKEFDRLFLTFMIRHHQGAITMVNALFGTGAGEQEKVFRFASDVFADQTTEIARMQKMLAALLFQGRGQ